MIERLTRSYYPADMRLKEDELREEFNISRTPIREILRQLEHDDGSSPGGEHGHCRLFH